MNFTQKHCDIDSAPSRPSVVRVPVPLQVRNQGGAERAIGLISRIGRAVASKQIERFLADAQRTAVANCADRARIAEAIDHVRERSVHLVGPRYLVTDQPALWTVTREPSLVLDCLACDAIAREARQAQIGQTWNDAFLARRQRHEGI